AARSEPDSRGGGDLGAHVLPAGGDELGAAPADAGAAGADREEVTRGGDAGLPGSRVPDRRTPRLPTLSGRRGRSHDRDLERTVQGLRDAVEHADRVPAIVGVLEPGNDRLRGAHQLREPGLGETSGGALAVYHLGDVKVQPGSGGGRPR